MRIVRTKLNIFTVILFVAVVASSLQLDYLKNGFGIVRDYLWVQANLLSRQNEACVNCGKETATTEKPVRIFEPERIVITRIQVDLDIVSVPLRNGTWKVYPKVANYAEGTSLVNEKEGNVGLYAHARPDAFGNINALKIDDEIIVYGKNYKAIYSVIKTSVVEPTDVSVFYPEKDPIITLITCDGPKDEKRYVVRAKLTALQRLHEALTMAE